MNSNKPYRSHLVSSRDLTTSDVASRAWRASLKLEEERRAEPFKAQARAVRAAAVSATAPNDLARIRELQSALLVASGVAREDLAHLTAREKTAAVKSFVANRLTPAGPNFVEELLHHFLLAQSKSLGAKMRRAGDMLARRRLSRAIISNLALACARYFWLNAATNSWDSMPKYDFGIDVWVRGLSWGMGSERRTVVYAGPVPLLGGGVDVCLFNCGHQELHASYGMPAAYLAAGELKGAIDPAGADEHWKTARTALERIRKEFGKHNLKPCTFFVGTAIVERVAKEIWDYLEDGTLENAANLTVDDQVASISRWLCSL